MTLRTTLEATRYQSKRLTLAKALIAMGVAGGAVLATACGAPADQGEPTGSTAEDLIVIYHPPPFAGCKGLPALPTTPIYPASPAPSCPAYSPSTNYNCWGSAIIGYEASFEVTRLPWSCPSINLGNGKYWPGYTATFENTNHYNSLCGGGDDPDAYFPHPGSYNCLYAFDDIPGGQPVDASAFCSTNVRAINYIMGDPAVGCGYVPGGGGRPTCEVCSTF